MTSAGGDAQLRLFAYALGFSLLGDITLLLPKRYFPAGVLAFAALLVQRLRFVRGLTAFSLPADERFQGLTEERRAVQCGDTNGQPDSTHGWTMRRIRAGP